MERLGFVGLGWLIVVVVGDAEDVEFGLEGEARAFRLEAFEEIAISADSVSISIVLEGEVGEAKKSGEVNPTRPLGAGGSEAVWVEGGGGGGGGEGGSLLSESTSIDVFVFVLVSVSSEPPDSSLARRLARTTSGLSAASAFGDVGGGVGIGEEETTESAESPFDPKAQSEIDCMLVTGRGMVCCGCSNKVILIPTRSEETTKIIKY